jgi:glycosyltransferase involved in cell wall biosynthesis
VETGGLSRAVLDSVLGLAEAGAKVTLLSYAAEKGGTLDFPWKHNPPAQLSVVLCAPPTGKRSHHWASSEMRDALDAQLPETDAVHLHGLWEPLSATVAKKASALGIPTVCSVHGMLDPWSMKQRAMKKRVYYALVEKRRLARAGAIHFTAEQEKKKAARWIPRGTRSVVLPVMMELGAYRQLPDREAAHALFPGVPSDQPWILFLSRIHEKKGLDILLDAVSKLRDKNAQLVIAGTGDDGYVQLMRERVQQRGIAGRTHFVGVVRGEAKVALYRRAAMLALPTSQENFGLVFPEALACETPVLLTEGVDIYEELVSAGAGELIRRDAEDVAAKIDALLANPEEARRRGEAGRRWVFQTLEPSAIARQWLDVYHSLLAPSHL